jgi:hypothetical protein
MLSLDRPGHSQGRRQGQHVRHPDDQASVEACTAIPRHGNSGAGRYLSRLAKSELAVRLLPAAVALTEAAGPVPASKLRAREVELKFTASVPCLLGQCRFSGDGPGCESGACEHDCHDRDRAAGGG